MFDFITKLFDTSGFPPRWYCGSWTSGHGWLHILSDLGVWSAYVAIPCVLGYFVLRKKDVPFPTIFWLFGAFILACGTTHLMEVLIFWWPAYRLAGVIKLFTALISWATVVALVPITPRALMMRSPTELEAEIARRREVEAQLLEAQADLENQVRERTLALQESEERHRMLVELHHDAILVNDGEKVIFANPAAARLLGGQSPEDLLGRRQLDFLPADLHAAAVDRWDKVVHTGTPAPRLEQKWRRLDGSLVLVEIAVYRFPGRGQPQLLVIARDLTERQRSEALFRIAVEAAPNGMLMVKHDGGITLANDQVQKMFGYHAEELIDQPVEKLVPARWREKHPGYRGLFFGDPRTRSMGGGRELFGLRKDGSEFPVEIGLQPVPMAEGLSVLASIIDVSERRRAEEALRQSETRFRQLADAMPQIVWAARPDGYLDYYNERWYEFTGFPKDMGGDESWTPILHSDDLPMSLEVWYGAVRSGQQYQIEYRFKDRRTGGYRWFLGRALPVKDEQGRVVRWFGTCTDIADQKRAEEALRDLNTTLELRVAERTAAAEERAREVQASLEENQVLLREIHHRVKNNLQVISSLLDLQSQYTRDESMVEMFRESQNRVRSMALVHERLYQSEVLSSIDFGEYLNNLVSQLSTTYSVSGRPVRFDLDLEPVRLSIDAAVPCGLAVNELVSNCLKYAFPDRECGVVSIRLAQGGGDVVLSVHDDGIGLPEPITFQNPKTFGLRLVNALVEQLHGKARVERSGGTTVQITFPRERSKAGQGETRP